MPSHDCNKTWRYSERFTFPEEDMDDSEGVLGATCLNHFKSTFVNSCWVTLIPRGRLFVDILNILLPSASASVHGSQIPVPGVSQLNLSADH